MKKLLLVIIILFSNCYYCLAAETGTGITAVRKGGIKNSLTLSPIQIIDIQANSPAEKANIPINWYIIDINGYQTNNLTEIQCANLLKSNGTIVLGISPIPTIYNNMYAKYKITNENGFINEVTYLPKTKGIGLAIYKYNLNLNMPAVILDVKKGSPAEKTGVKPFSLIQKINNISTVDLSTPECLKLLNSNKNLELEISDLQGQNTKLYNLKREYYFKSENQAPKKYGLLGRSLVGFAKYNSMESLLTEYFKTLAPTYKPTNNMTNAEMRNKDILRIQEEYEIYLKNKNNMEFNKYLYDGLNTFIWQYGELQKEHITVVKDILVYYEKLDNDASEQDVVNYIKSLELTNKNYYLEWIIFYENHIKKWESLAKEILDYSIAYEKRLKSNDKLNTPYFVDNADFRDILYGWYGTKQPKKNGIYVISSGTGAKVLQSVSGGILVTAEHSNIVRNPRVIYITTKRQYADRDYIKGNMFVVFEGYYSYYNTLGSMNKIYKFKEVPQAEYWNRVQNKKYYFIK